MKNTKIHPQQAICGALFISVGFGFFSPHHQPHLPAGSLAQSIPLSIYAGTSIFNVAGTTSNVAITSTNLDLSDGTAQATQLMAEHPADAWQSHHGFDLEV